jgi:hypothetical protein
MGFVVIGLLLVLVAVGVLTLRAVAELRQNITRQFGLLVDLLGTLNRLTLDTVKTAEEANLLQHRISRMYVGKSLIEDTLLPHVGWRPKEKTPVEKWMLDTWEHSDKEQSQLA